MNKRIIAGASVLAAAVTLGASSAALAANQYSAHTHNGNGTGNGYSQQLEAKATALKMSTDQLREELKTKTLTQIAEEKQVSLDAVHQATQTAARARWQANGLSADETKARETAMAERQADCDGTGNNDGSGSGRMHHGQN